MRLFEQISALKTYIRGVRQDGRIVGLVPTMGALHEGHLGLIRKAKANGGVVIVSIFVNPTQFGPAEDLQRYPRQMPKDQQLCSTEGVDALFAPSADQMYPAGFQTSVHVSEAAGVLEGVRRPIHFSGVATVVLKLLNIVQPDQAYFGQKDYQQFVVVKRMCADLNLHSELVMVGTVRAQDGLALSSRNAYLSEQERSAATILYRCLKLAQCRVLEGARDPAAVTNEMQQLIASEPLATADYVCIADPETLRPVSDLQAGPAVALVAVCIGSTRLIDNMALVPNSAFATRPARSQA